MLKYGLKKAQNCPKRPHRARNNIQDIIFPLFRVSVFAKRLFLFCSFEQAGKNSPFWCSAHRVPTATTTQRQNAVKLL